MPDVQSPYYPAAGATTKHEYTKEHKAFFCWQILAKAGEKKPGRREEKYNFFLPFFPAKILCESSCL